VIKAHSSLPDRSTMDTKTAPMKHNKSHEASLTPPFWCVVRRLPNAQNSVIARFDVRTAAEAHLQFLAKKSPDTTYNVVFDFGLR